MVNSTSKHSILGVTVHTYSLQEVLEIVYSKFDTNQQHNSKTTSTDGKNPQESAVLPVYTINPEIVVLANQFPEYKTILNHAFIAVSDGVGIYLTGLLTGKRFPERITGIDLVVELTKLAFEHDLKVGFLGGREDSAKKTMEQFKNRYPHLGAWADPGPSIDCIFPEKNGSSSNTVKNISKLINIHQNSEELNVLLHQIASSDILFVAFGAPKQELFIELLKTYTSALTPLIAVGVGGALDELSGVTPRPPKWIQSIGMKWLFRLATEPWRWKRQLRIFKFIQLALNLKK
jgi:N-acetylglucosaminyldiphosphoundecaprenol N-acetyl-beta-D-mannosaminyltransferase